jgi:hypothetical protein
MGGYGSGRRWNSRTTTCDYQQLDVRRWQRDGLLLAGQSFIRGWWSVEVIAALEVRAKPDHLILSHVVRREQYSVRLAWTPCNYGGARVWFLCPARGCGRRVAILYGSGALACRHCYQLAYPSQQESERHRMLHRAQAIRMRLRGSPSLADPFPERPKGMHRRTYKQLFSEAHAREGAFLVDTLAFLGKCQRGITT